MKVFSNICVSWIKCLVVSVLILFSLHGINNRIYGNTLPSIAEMTEGSKTKELLEYAREIHTDSLDKAMELLKEAAFLAIQYKQDGELAEANFLMGEVSFYKELFSDANEKYHRALEYYYGIGDSAQIAEIHFCIGLSKYYLNDISGALEDYYEAFNLFRRLGDDDSMAKLYQNLGLVYFDTGNINRALYYYQMALDLNKKLNNLNRVAGVQQNIAIVFYREKNYDKALEEFQFALASFEKLEDKEGIASVLSNIGLIYEAQKEFDKAYDKYNSALQLFREMDYNRGEVITLFNIGSILFNQKKHYEAIEHYEKSLAIALEYGYKELVPEIYNSLTQIYENIYDYEKALNYYRKYTSFKDSLNIIQSRERIDELHTMFDVKLKEEELFRKSEQLKYQTRLKYIFSSVSLILAVLFGGLIFAYYQKSKVKKELEKHKVHLEHLVEERTAELKLEISERKVAEESDRLKSAFLANMSHEIRTPMNAIIAFSSFLKEPNLSNSLRNEYIEYINSCGSHLLQLIEDIIDTAKIEAKQLTINKTRCNVTALVTELHSYYKSLKSDKEPGKLSVYRVVPAEDKSYFIITDPFRLRQVLTNIIDNAIKFTDEGTIEFGFRDVNNSYLEFFVTDTGPGIPEDKSDLVFERFRQIDENLSKKTGGTGLGLNICKSLVSLMGGKIWFKSKPGEGTTFYFTIPYNDLAINDDAEVFRKKKVLDKANRQKYNWGKKIILVVEDEELNFKVIETALKRTKAKVLRASNGKQAIEMVNSPQVIDIVLMDIQMPELDGYEATKQIKQIREKLPVIAQTAYALSGEREKCLQAGCDDYLSKPIKLDELLLKIDRFFMNGSENR